MLIVKTVIRWIILVLKSDWLRHGQSHCKILDIHTHVTASQSLNFVLVNKGRIVYINIVDKFK